MPERLAALAAALVFCGWAVSLLAGRKGGKERDAPTGKPADDTAAEETADASSRDQTTATNVRWRWKHARRDNPPIVAVERIDQPPPGEPQPPAPSRPALRPVPDLPPEPAPAPEGLDPMSIARRAAELARKRHRLQAAAKGVQVAPATGKVISLEGRVTIATGKPVGQAPATAEAADVPMVALNAPAGGQMRSLVETIAESAALLARIAPGGDIRNPIAQLAAFAQAQAAIARAVAELRERMGEDRHDLVVLAFIDQAEAITRTAATSLGETAVAAAIRYQGTASDQARGTGLPNVNRG